MSNKKTKKQNQFVKIKLNSDETLYGNLNIDGFNRLSDFLEDDTYKHVKLYGASKNHKSISPIIIPKTSISYYIPVKKQ